MSVYVISSLTRVLPNRGMKSRGLLSYVLFLLNGDKTIMFLVSVDDVRGSKCGSVSS